MDAVDGAEASDLFEHLGPVGHQHADLGRQEALAPVDARTNKIEAGVAGDAGSDGVEGRAFVGADGVVSVGDLQEQLDELKSNFVVHEVGAVRASADAQTGGVLHCVVSGETPAPIGRGRPCSRVSTAPRLAYRCAMAVAQRWGLAQRRASPPTLGASRPMGRGRRAVIF